MFDYPDIFTARGAPPPRARAARLEESLLARAAGAVLAALVFSVSRHNDGRAASLRTAHAARADARQPHSRLADVSVLERRRVRQRLALRPSGQPRRRR